MFCFRDGFGELGVFRDLDFFGDGLGVLEGFSSIFWLMGKVKNFGFVARMLLISLFIDVSDFFT